MGMRYKVIYWAFGNRSEKTFPTQSQAQQFLVSLNSRYVDKSTIVTVNDNAVYRDADPAVAMLD